MQQADHHELRAFLAVARERSFTRAAAQMGLSQSALSRSIANLEARLGVRLLNRTTRSVAPTVAGERLAAGLAPHFEGIEAQLAALGDIRERPAGLVRITADESAAQCVLWPALSRFLPDYPDVEVEVVVDNALTDIVAAGLDAGVRSGDIVDRDMIAVPIGEDQRMAAVASPAYLAGRTPPRHPRELTEHRCINIRLATLGGLYAWEFDRDGREMRVRVGGQLTFNTSDLVVRAALDGFGIAFLPECQFQDHIATGRLIRLLDDWCEPYPGYHLYYPSRRQVSPALRVVIDGLRLARRSVSMRATVGD
ncbi:LysR family transcriptional regulator [Novosphingobium rosa]|uniref:LysR family transcriptional regulator n=1 Tax=Novosphingobium rosa TaxID=76978 RepID=UPI000831511C|nr:LysR family transcriptional regulator [Novosphingobium rosa]